jgi:hypothetical protein
MNWSYWLLLAVGAFLWGCWRLIWLMVVLSYRFMWLLLVAPLVLVHGATSRRKHYSRHHRGRGERGPFTTRSRVSRSRGRRRSPR